MNGTHDGPDAGSGWAVELPAALAGGRLHLDCQPIMPAAGGPPAAHELLLRLNRADGTLCMPGTFLPYAERTGLSRLLDRWVVRHALEWLARRRRAAGTPHMLTINLSAPSIIDRGFLQHVRGLLDSTGADPTHVCLEVTESAAITDLRAAAVVLGELRSLGMRIALDDFGTGFSSLDYLHALPVDCLKIDGVFISGMLVRDVDLAIVRSVITLGHSLDLHVVAEFVERPEQVQALRELGVDFLQGYAFGRPFALRDLD